MVARPKTNPVLVDNQPKKATMGQEPTTHQLQVSRSRFAEQSFPSALWVNDTNASVENLVFVDKDYQLESLLWPVSRGPETRVFFPGSIAKGSSSKSGCQLHLPTSHANLSIVTSPANFSCQLVESYFTCQLLMPTCRELLHLPTSHVNFLRVTSPANFSCQLFGCYLILLKAQANLSGVTSLS